MIFRIIYLNILKKYEFVLQYSVNNVYLQRFSVKQLIR